jgi:D-galactarolactone isomerase
MHVYGDPAVYPPRPDSPFRPVPGGDLETYLALRRTLGIERTVVVQPTAYGADNRCTLDAMARLGDSARGVAVVTPDVTEAELARLTALGVRGLRFFLLAPGPLGWADLAPMAARVAPFGWHVQVQMDGRLLPDHAAALGALPCPLVIDHNAKFLEPVTEDHPGVAALWRLVDAGRTWVKTSAVYETSHAGPPGYADVAWLPRQLIARAPDRCVWATNWPHPSKAAAPPDDSQLLDLAAEWCGSAAVLRQVMVDTPAALYGFA